MCYANKGTRPQGKSLRPQRCKESNTFWGNKGIVLHLRSSLIVNASRFAVGRVNVKTHCLSFSFALPLKIIRVSIKRSYTD